MIRIAEPTDINNIKSIADKHRKEIGFVIRSALLNSIDRNECIIKVADGRPVGFCHFHKRLDNWTTVYELAVINEFRKLGYGLEMINWLIDDGHTIRLKCPVDNESNNFYNKIGKLSETVKGRKRDLNVWIIK